jgi:ATP-dependent exoDNAse (exonuclease V) beta subunit
MENLYAEPDAAASGRLQIMTIYAAKGLQFDHVILPGLDRKPGTDSGKLLHWFELAGEDRIVMAPMRNSADKERQKTGSDLIRYISGVEKKRRALEDGRLLYVAATRAISHLHLFAAVKPNAKGVIRPDPSSLVGCLWPAVEKEQASLVRRAAQEEQAETSPSPEPESSAVDLPQVARRLADDWSLPDPPAPIRMDRADLPEARDYIEFSWAGEDAQLTGNLVHRMLQQIALEGFDALRSGENGNRYEDWCRRQLGAEGVTGAQATRIVERAWRALSNCLESKTGRWILQPHSEARSEYALTAVLDGIPVNVVLDRTFVDGGDRWIIDYKTSSHAGGDLEGFLESEKERYRDQLRTYRRAVSLSEERPIRTALYFPLLDRLCEVE